MVLLICWGLLLLFVQQVPYDNIASRWALTLAVARHGTLAIDAYHERTADKSFFQGHYYSDKAPGTALLAAPLVWLFDAAGASREPEVEIWLRYASRGLTVSLAAALAAALCASLAMKLGAPLIRARLAAFLLVAATPFGVYATMFYSHALAGAFLLFSFWCAHRAVRHRAGIGASFGAGVLASASVVTEYPTAVAAAILAVYLVVGRGGAKRMLEFCAGALPLILLHMGYSWACYGVPLATGYAHKFVQDHAWVHSQGIGGILLPQPAVAVKLLFSPQKGLFFLSPVLLLAPLGLARLIRDPARRREGLTFAALALAMFLINAGFVDWAAGWTFGPRHMTAMLPFLIVGLAVPPLRTGTGAATGEWSALLGLGAISAGVAFAAAVTLPQAPLVFENPVTGFYLPLLGDGYVSTVFSAISAQAGAWSWFAPLLLGVAGALLMLWPQRTDQRRFSLQLPATALVGPAAAAAMLVIHMFTASPAGPDQQEQLAQTLMNNHLFVPAAHRWEIAFALDPARSYAQQAAAACFSFAQQLEE